MLQSTIVDGIARLMKAASEIPRRYILGLQLIAVLACLATIGWPQLKSSLAETLRYQASTQPDYTSVNTWIETAECARRTGAWAALCEDGKMVPLGADDPGHSILLGFWARLANRPMTLVDVARLNLAINVLGLAILVATLMVLGAFSTAMVVLVFGPYAFLEWFGMSPHWALIGITSMQVALPLGLIARSRKLVHPAIAYTLIVVGMLVLCLGSLVREAIGLMTITITTGVVGWIVIQNVWQPRRLAGIALIAMLAVAGSQTARLAVVARDVVYGIEAPQAPATHGIGHNLYLGLGVVENRFGMRWDDDMALKAAREVSPGVQDYSRDYFRVMWRLYFDRWRENPGEVIRIYFEKAKIILADPIIDWAPPLWLLLLLATGIHWLSNGRNLSCGSAQCDNRFAINLVSIAFVGFFIAQAIIAHPTRLYAMPIGAFILVMLGISLENLGAWIWRAASRLSNGC